MMASELSELRKIYWVLLAEGVAGGTQALRLLKVDKSKMVIYDNSDQKMALFGMLSIVNLV